MDEIALLQQQLAAVQQQESALKLSDHNVIDLLLKLQQLGKVQVVHTLSGTQLLTPAQVEREIADYVTLGAGRASLAELQQQLNVDRAYVDKHVAQLAKSSHVAARKGGNGGHSSVYYVINLGEEVVTNWYLDAIMEDTNALLADRGAVSVGELAQQFGLSVDYMKEVVQARLGSVLRAQERGNVLYTAAFVAGQRAQLRGVLAAATRPTFLPDVVRAYGLDDEVADECAAEMVRVGALPGVLRGREYVPFVFLAAQREGLCSFFQQNGFLERRRAAALQVARPLELLRTRFPDAVPLETCVVSAALRLQLEAAVEAALSDGAVLDAAAVVPSGVPTADVALLLRQSPLLAGDKAATVVCDVYVVSGAVVAECEARMAEDAARKAAKAAEAEQQAGRSSAKRSAVAVDSEDSDEDDAGGRRGAKGKGKRGSQGRGKHAPATEEPVGGGKAKGATKGKRGKRGGGGGGDDAGDDAPTPATSKRKASKTKAKTEASNASVSTSITPSRESLAALLVEWLPQLEDFAADEELVLGLAEHLEAEAERVYAGALAAALSSVLRGDAASLRDLRRRFEDRFDALLAPLLALDKGLRKLSALVDTQDAAAAAQLDAVEAHVLDTAGAELAALVTSFVAEANGLVLPGVPPLSAHAAAAAEDSSGRDSGGEPGPLADPLAELSEDNKKTLEKELPPATAAAVVRLWTLATAGRRSLGDLVAHVPALAEALGMPLRKQDRKRERQVVFAHRRALLERLDRLAETGEAPVAAAAVALQLLFQQAMGLPARFPQDHVAYAPMVLAALAATVPPEALAQFRRLVEQAEATGEAQADVEERAALLQDVRALLALKDLGAAS